MTRDICAATAAVLLFATAAGAQSLQPLEDLTVLGTTVYVVDTSGEETKGRIVGLTDLALTLKFDDTRQQFALADVARVERQKRDPVRNGVLIGAVAGALAGFTLGKPMDSTACPQRGPECGQGALIGTIGGAFWGAVGGWIVDALVHTRERVYVAHP
jgi:hypothetical protein